MSSLQLTCDVLKDSFASQWESPRRAENKKRAGSDATTTFVAISQVALIPPEDSAARSRRTRRGSRRPDDTS
jgi:hypothetical protein